MDVSDRQLRILNYLLSRKDFVTAGDIAHQVGTSARTVYRDIASLNSISHMIENAPSKGIRLDYNAYLSGVERLTRRTPSTGLSILARRRATYLLLLFSAPKTRSINEFSEIFYVSPSSIQNDLQHVATLAEGHGLELSSDHSGTTVCGGEDGIRNALVDVANPLIVHDSASKADTDEELAFLRSQGIFSERDLDAVATAIARVEEAHDLYLENPYYINILTHLVIMIERLRLAAAQQGDPASLGIETRPWPVDTDPELVAAAQDLAREVGSLAELELPPSETSNIYAFLQGSDAKPEASGTVDGRADGYARQFTRSLIDLISTDLGIDLRSDAVLLDKMALHVKPMLFRTQNGVQVRNPVAADIREHFPAVLDSVSRCLRELESHSGLRASSESEAAFLVLYVQQAIERLSRRLRVIIACSTGRGTALFLRSRVEARFPDWQILDVVSVRNLRESFDRITNLSSVDLVVATVKLDGFPVRSVTVSTLLTDRDADLLVQAAREAGWSGS